MNDREDLRRLRSEVCTANRALAEAKLAPLTWGNVSGISSRRDIIAIKPSGIAYEDLTPDDIPLVDLDGRVVEGRLRPSTDTATHCAIYRAWPHVGGVAHSHSPYATMFAQARRPIPCLGTTHADHFAGDVPVARQLTAEEVAAGYEEATGKVIVERFAQLDAMSIPGVLVAGHAPFTWGASARAALENAIALEAIAHMALGTMVGLASAIALEPHILAKHRARKYGADAYYGQRERRSP
ncbi:MAG: L-ribulose-5-phosphate 4-epimerase AraD [Phycisphaerae bacterium]|jgi:L-ribulose-5-phosphate 4-epimerase|nr:L-ribulose-5-phosphate 4-epimerase AraD [Phycisphaerae bacterium]